MKPRTTLIPPDVRAILARSTISGVSLTLPEQLHRATYQRVDKVLRGTGGKWDRKARCHRFPFPAAELIDEAVQTGAYVDRKATLQFFPTPPDLARHMATLARVQPGDVVLEPSAGHGAIVLQLLADGAHVVAVEIDTTNCQLLGTIDAGSNLEIYGGDFLTWPPSRDGFDAVCMNPPFSGGQDMAHIRRAFDLLAPGGRLVAICSEGSFFRTDQASCDFRDWLDRIGATAEQLDRDTFQAAGTTVATRLIVAYQDGTRQTVANPDDTPTVVQTLPLDLVDPDPGQPRKLFDRQGLRDLAASIAADGLLQPITVRRVGSRYTVVAGERRYRASLLNHATTIRAIVIVARDPADIRVKQIIENDQRVDVTPLEQAQSYQALMDQTGMTVEQLAKRIGKQPFRITERTILLKLAPEYQQLLAGGNLKASEAWEMARLSPRAQAVLFRAIKAGKCERHADLRAMANGLAQTELQTGLAMDEPPPPSADDVRTSNGFETNVERIAAMLRSAITDNQVTALRKVRPDRVEHIADLMAAMQRDLRRIETSLREAAAQRSLLDA